MAQRIQVNYFDGIELITEKNLEHIEEDRWKINAGLSFLTFFCFILGATITVELAYAGFILYFIQICEYFLSLTRLILPNVECDEKIKNLISEYQKERPVIQLVYPKQEKKENSNKVMPEVDILDKVRKDILKEWEYNVWSDTSAPFSSL